MTSEIADEQVLIISYFPYKSWDEQSRWLKYVYARIISIGGKKLNTYWSLFLKTYYLKSETRVGNKISFSLYSNFTRSFLIVCFFVKIIDTQLASLFQMLKNTWRDTVEYGNVILLVHANNIKVHFKGETLTNVICLIITPYS